MTDIARSYDTAARAMHACERRIASLTQWGRPSPDSINGRALAALEAMRVRDAPALEKLRAQAARARKPAEIVTSGDFPIATRKTAIDPALFPDLPPFLRRAAP